MKTGIEAIEAIDELTAKAIRANIWRALRIGLVAGVLIGVIATVVGVIIFLHL